jgi:hypothetical protein
VLTVCHYHAQKDPTLLSSSTSTMKTFIAVTLCLCLLLAPVAQAQTTALVNNIISGCTTGMTSTLCKGAMSRAQSLCKTPNGGGNCVKMLTDLCRVRKSRNALRSPSAIELTDGSSDGDLASDTTCTAAVQPRLVSRTAVSLKELMNCAWCVRCCSPSFCGRAVEHIAAGVLHACTCCLTLNCAEKREDLQDRVWPLVQGNWLVCKPV